MFIGFIIAVILGLSTQSIFVFCLVLIIAIIGGVYLMATGAAQRFDYQKQSGTIIHQGDWRR